MSCPSCGVLSEPGARFCASCGGPFASQSDERRVLTVLFGDIVGYTALAEARDPELVKNLIDDLFQRLVTDITDFGGQVDKIVGDAIVALFGAPTAHEDDAERAVRAALRMQQTIAGLGLAAVRTGAQSTELLDTPIRMRIGVNTGEVLVGALRAGGAVTAMGDVVNTASRLQTSADPGEVVVGPTTYDATRDVIRYEPRGRLDVKGRDELVTAWTACEALRPPGYRPKRLAVPLIGRDTEVQLLQQMIKSGVSNSRALLALLVGDAGVGKTRLTEAALRGAVARYGALAYQGRCVPYGEANVWWPVAEALRQACLIDPGADEDEARSRAFSRVSAMLGPTSQQTEVERVANGLLFLMGHATGLDEIEPANAREEAVWAVVRFLEGATENQPVVVQISDLHWADDAVLQLVETVLERLARRPFMLLATARQGIRERWNPQPGRFNTLNLNLDPLTPESAKELLDQLLGPAASLEWANALIERSGGNPFFLEELVALVGERSPTASADRSSEAGLGELPDTLRGLVAARLDGLTADERSVLTDAAVLGRRGSLENLRLVTEGSGHTTDVGVAVSALVEKEFFELSEDIWEFRSDLVREVAYNTITKLDRARRHVGIANWVETNKVGDWSDIAVDRMAHHYGLGAELLIDLGGTDASLGNVLEKALHWISEAADRARESDLNKSALRLYSQGLELVGKEPELRRVTLLLGRSAVRTTMWELEGAQADAEAAIADAEMLGDESCGARGLLVLGEAVQKTGDVDRAIALLGEATNRFTALGDELGRGESLRQQGLAELFRGAVEPAEAAVRSSLEAFRAAKSRRGEAWALQNLAWIAFTTGNIDQADERLNRSLATFEELGDLIGTGWVRGLMAFVKFHQGHHDQARELATDVLVDARRRNDKWPTAMMLVLLGQLDLWSGRTRDAVVQAEEARRIFINIGDPYGRSQASAPLARALIMVGRIDEGLGQLDEAIEAAEALPGYEQVLLAEAALAGASVQLGEPKRALQGSSQSDGLMAPTSPQAGVELAMATILALVQSERVGEAAELLATLVPTAPADQRPLLRSTIAVVAAAQGNLAEAISQAEAIPIHPAATYLDSVMAQLAVALAASAANDKPLADHWINESRRLVDATEDLLAQALVRLASATALERLQSNDAATARTEAESRLSQLGIDAYGWRIAFALMSGTGKPAPDQ